jgi:hypothetical protein
MKNILIAAELYPLRVFCSVRQEKVNESILSYGIARHLVITVESFRLTSQQKDK